MFNLATVDTAITAALGAGEVSSQGFLTLAIAIPVAFFVFKLGKRALGKA